MMKALLRRRKSYTKKLVPRLMEHREFLVERMRKEWETMESDRQKRERREKMIDLSKKAGVAVGQAILISALFAGVMVTAAVAPNVFSAFGKIYGRRRQFFDKKEFRQNVIYLKHRKYIKVVRHDKETYEISLTELGSQKAVAHVFGRMKMTTPERWDGIWRIVIFDISESHKWAREGVRERLKILGFYRLQDSVFVYPHPCFEEIEFIASVYNVAGDLKFMETAKLYGDEEILGFFSLSHPRRS